MASLADLKALLAARALSSPAAAGPKPIAAATTLPVNTRRVLAAALHADTDVDLPLPGAR